MSKVKPKSIAIEFDDVENRISNISILDNAGTSHIFSDIEVEKELTIPEPYGCEFVVTNIKDRQLATAKFEIEFLSGYSRECVFYAATYITKNAT
ncbi:MAG: hypothetical protein KBT66_12700 [Amphritea sp.]|nr:hypothetical protein [Amphritea sp.]